MFTFALTPVSVSNDPLNYAIYTLRLHNLLRAIALTGNIITYLCSIASIINGKINPAGL